MWFLVSLSYSLFLGEVPEKFVSNSLSHKSHFDAPESRCSFHILSFFPPSHGSTEIYDEDKEGKHLVLYFLYIPTI